MKEAWELLPWIVRAPIETVVRSVMLYMRDDCAVYAAAISYYALFSLVPLALLTLALFGLFVDQDNFVDFVFEQFPIRETPAERQRVADVIEQSRNLSGAGILLALPVLLWTGSGLFTAIRRGLNATEHFRAHRPIWHAKLVDIAMVPSLGLLVISSVALTAATQIVLQRAGDLGPVQIDTSGAVRTASLVLPALVSFLMFTLVYRLVPHARPSWPEALSSAVIATILFETLKLSGALLLSATDFATGTGVYAGIGVVFVFLFWVYLNGSILLFGAEFGQAIFEPDEEEARLRHEEQSQGGRRWWLRPWRA